MDIIKNHPEKIAIEKFRSKYSNELNKLLRNPLANYFKQKRNKITHVHWDADRWAAFTEKDNVTTFEKRVYDLCKKVPKGKVTTYKILAEKLGTKAYRAVGQALRCNPFGAWGRVGGKSFRRKRCIVPCHRVIKSDGSIGGFSGSINPKSKEVKRKIRILKKEGIIIKNNEVVNLKQFVV